MLCISIAMSIYARAQRRSGAARRAREIEHSEGSLEQDQRMFVGDMRQLRHDMLRGASNGIVSADREDVRQDWLAIVMVRGLARYGRAPALMGLTRFVHSRIEPYR